MLKNDDVSSQSPPSPPGKQVPMAPRLRAGVSNIWWSRHPLLRIFQQPTINLNISSLSQPKLSLCTLDKECDDFLPWLERKAGTEISSVLSIGKSAQGRALFASKIIRTGDCILRVPYNVQLASDNLSPEINKLIGDDIGNVAKLAIVVLLEKKLGWDSDWAPYVSRLPHPREMQNTIFWCEDELGMVLQSSLYQETVEKKSHAEKEYLAIRQAIEHIPEISETITYRDFMHAYALVISRAWGSTKGVSLIPFADFLNHDGSSEAFVLNDDDKQLSEINSVVLGIVRVLQKHVVADRNYSPGEQVLIRYGKFSNATLMLDFGFTVPYNIHDQVHIQLNIPHHDPLRKMKLEILQRHHAAISKDVPDFISSMDSFTIREVRSFNGKGKGIPQSLRAFGRVLCCTSPQELSDLVKEAEQTDGRLARRPLRNVNRETEAHQILLAQITRLVEEYEASIETLELGSAQFVCERLALRRRMAQDLLNGELRVLKSASAWLGNYCTALTMAGNSQSLSQN